MSLKFLSHNHRSKVYSELLEVEFTKSSIKLCPLSPSNLQKFLKIAIIPMAIQTMTGRNISATEIDYDSIIGYKADPGFPVLGKPVVTLLYIHNSLREERLITFEPYTIIPPLPYNRLKALLNLHSLANQSNKINFYARLLSWLFVPFSLMLGFYVAKNFSGAIRIFGAVFFLYGVLMIFMTIAELIWRTIQLFRIKQ
jgi:hypothetical protein